MDFKQFLERSKDFPVPEEVRALSYGTAGFRARSGILSSTVFRCGALIALRAMKLRKVTGIMITASHNPEHDNGVKLVEPEGEMLVPLWEEYATRLARAETDSLIIELNAILETECISPCASCVFIGYDTRSSSTTLALAARKGAESVGSSVLDLGLRTTPQLHFAVLAANSGKDTQEAAYFETLVCGFKALALSSDQAGKLVVDCANGVGAPKLSMLNDHLSGTGLQIEVRNTGGGELNKGCGSDYVHTSKLLPEGFSASGGNLRCASIDGDADRLVYFSAADGERSVELFDGDRIACLVALFLTDVLSGLPPGFTVSRRRTSAIPRPTLDARRPLFAGRRPCAADSPGDPALQGALAGRASRKGPAASALPAMRCLERVPGGGEDRCRFSDRR